MVGEKNMTISEAAVKWGMSRSLIGYYLRAGRIPSAFKAPISTWSIPEDSPPPEPLKRGRKPLKRQMADSVIKIGVHDGRNTEVGNI